MFNCYSEQDGHYTNVQILNIPCVHARYTYSQQFMFMQPIAGVLMVEHVSAQIDVTVLPIGKDPTASKVSMRHACTYNS